MFSLRGLFTRMRPFLARIDKASGLVDGEMATTNEKDRVCILGVPPDADLDPGRVKKKHYFVGRVPGCVEKGPHRAVLVHLRK